MPAVSVLMPVYNGERHLRPALDSILAQSFGGGGKVTAEDLARSLLGAVAKEGAEDLKSLREYCETVAKTRGGAWKDFYQAARSRIRA